MKLYLIERQFAEQIAIDADGLRAITRINGEVGVNWLQSFLSADGRHSYCLYEADNPEAIAEAARLAGIPADKIVEVSNLSPEHALAQAG
jgi:hypothetical protein